MSRSVLVLLAALALSACKENDDRVDAILALDGDAAAGETLYGSDCAVCHATDGSGGTGPSLQGGPSDQIVVDQVINGGGSMPAFDDYADQDIADVLAYLKDSIYE